MKTQLSGPLILLALFLSACASPRPAAVLAPVGPSPFEEPTTSPNGSLEVFSAWDIGIPGESEYVDNHSGYRIASSDGKQSRYVDNRAGGTGYMAGDPVVLSLAPGRYNVLAQAENSGMVTVPVVIEAGKTTTVYLDGRKPALDGTKPNGADWVHLPNGLIAGWRGPEEGR